MDGSFLTGPPARAFLESFVEAMPDAVVVIGADFRLVASNAAARALFPNMRGQELISRSLRAPDILDAIAQVFRTGRTCKTIWLDRVPLERQFDVHVAPLARAVPGGAAVVSLHDTTESRRLDRMRADFVANASHELRTPLASLLGFIETMQGPARNDPAAQERFLKIMSEQGRRMARLVDDLLSLSRIEQTLHLQPDAQVDLSSIAAHMADALAPMAEDNGVEIRLDANEPVYVQGDRDELLRIAENLVENAIKYGGPSPIDIRTSEENGSGIFVVEDSGPGIAPEHLPRLTERFYRIDAEHSRAKGGTGLGLAIVKHIVARHRGRLTVESKPGQGSKFTVSLPLAIE